MDLNGNMTCIQILLNLLLCVYFTFLNILCKSFCYDNVLLISISPLILSRKSQLHSVGTFSRAVNLSEAGRTSGFERSFTAGGNLYL